MSAPKQEVWEQEKSFIIRQRTEKPLALLLLLFGFTALELKFMLRAFPPVMTDPLQ